MDLLSVLAHEFGHLLGQDHAEGGVMSETLGAGRPGSARGPRPRRGGRPAKPRRLSRGPSRLDAETEVTPQDFGSGAEAATVSAGLAAEPLAVAAPSFLWLARRVRLTRPGGCTRTG